MMGICLCLSSCGLIDFEFDEAIEPVYSMHLNHHSLYVMEGDTFALTPEFEPYVYPNIAVYWSTSSDSVLAVEDNNIIAIAPGEAYVSATSVVQGNVDSCCVTVMPQWRTDVYSYPYEMIMYTRMTVNGEPFDSSRMKVAAFVDDECRGEGEIREYAGVQYLYFRIMGNMYDSKGNPEIVRFRLYIRDMLFCDYLPIRYLFDGETHGSLSKPLTLSY